MFFIKNPIFEFILLSVCLSAVTDIQSVPKLQLIECETNLELIEYLKVNVKFNSAHKSRTPGEISSLQVD